MIKVEKTNSILRMRLDVPHAVNLEKIKRVPCRRWDPNARVWTAPATVAVAAEIVKIFGADEVRGNAEFETLFAAALVAGGAAAFKTAEGLDQPEIRKRDAWRHQLQAYHFASRLPAAMLDMHMGTGKSKVAVDLIINRGVRRVIIGAPARVVAGESKRRDDLPLNAMAVWPREFYKHAGHANWACWNETRGTTAQRARAMMEFLRLCEARRQVAIVVINYEAIWREAFAAAIAAADFDMAVCDEIHHIKAPAGVASRFFAKLGDTVPNRLGLTGTMIPHSPMDVYGQFRYLDKGIFGTSFTLFRARYAIMGGYGGHEIRGYQNEDELQAKVDSITYHAGPEVLDLPPRMDEYIIVELDPKTRAAYDQMEKTFIADVEAGRIVASNALSKLLRLQQITSGYLPAGEDTETVASIGSEKRDALAGLLGDIGKGEPVVVFVRFRHDLDQTAAAAAAAGLTYAELSGRRDDLRMWQMGGADVIGVQIQAGGEGIDLTRARYGVYFSLGYSLGDYEQSLCRVRRPEQERPVTYFHILARDTIDQRVYDALAKRRKVIDEIFYNFGKKYID